MQSPVSEPIRVLLVDDDPDFLEVGATHLEREDWLSVKTENDPDDGLSTVERGEVDCVVSDYRMPDKNGLELFETVRERAPGIPFILFTGRGSEAVASDAIASGVDDYVLKSAGPNPYDVLANRVRNAVEAARAETSYREIFEKAAIGLTVHDPQTGAFVDANRHFCEMLGYEDEDVTDLSLEAITNADETYTADLAREKIREAAEGTSDTFEWPDETADGERLWVEVTVRRAEIDGRDRVLAAVRDVQDRKERERRTDRLRAVTRELMTAETHDEIARIAVDAAADVVDVGHCGIYRFDDDGTLSPAAVVDVDEWFPDLATPVTGVEGSPVEEAVRSACRADDARLVRAGEAPLADDGAIGTLLVHPLGDHGALVAGASEAGALDDTDRSLLSVLTANATAALDRARRERQLRERETELARQNERLEDFAGIVSHDLRDPLEAAYGHLELAAMECDSEHHEGLREMLDRMNQVVDDALTLARHGHAVVDPGPVELGDVVDVAWDTAGTEAATLSVRDRLGTVMADRSRINQLLGNLVRNAVEHGGEDVTVRVGSLPDGFYVEDDGPGIPESERDEVFEIGYSTGEEGTGLGLAIVEEIAVAHGWSVIATESSDGGARFEVTGVDRD